MKEWMRTVVLVALFFIAIGFIVWSQNAYQDNFLDTLE